MLKYLPLLWIALSALGCSAGDVAEKGSASDEIQLVTSRQYLRMPFHEGPPDWPEIRNKEAQWASAVGLHFSRRDYPGPVEELWFRASLPEGLEDDSNIYLYGNMPSFVSGHGVPAALIASTVKVAFSAQEERAKDASHVLSDMNRIFCGKMKSQFVTAGYIYVDMHEQKLTYSTAGHPPLLIWRKSRRAVQEIRLNGMLMGHVPDAKYEEAKVEIEPGDRVVLYTDGIVEATNSDGEFFGKERLIDLIEAKNNLNADDFVDFFLSRLSSWTGRKLESEAFEDDLTFVVADVKEI